MTDLISCQDGRRHIAIEGCRPIVGMMPSRPEQIWMTMPYFRTIIAGLIVLVALLAGQVAGQTPAQRDPALILINALGCKGCHRIGNQGGSLATDLSQIGNRLSAAEILAQLTRHSAAIKDQNQDQDQFIPAYQAVTQEDWQLISHYLSQFQQTE